MAKFALTVSEKHAVEAMQRFPKEVARQTLRDLQEAREFAQLLASGNLQAAWENARTKATFLPILLLRATFGLTPLAMDGNLYDGVVHLVPSRRPSMVDIVRGKDEEYRYFSRWLAASDWLDRLIEATEPPDEPALSEPPPVLSAAAS